MQAIILAAGQGTRLRPLTDNYPKTLVKIGDRPILAYTLAALPPVIDEIIIVRKYLGQMIEDEFGATYQGRPIRYLDQGEEKGTGAAVATAQPFLKADQPFLVVNGDDLYSQADLDRLVTQGQGFAIGVAELVIIHPQTVMFETDDEGYLSGFHYPSEAEMAQKTRVSSGAYVLDHRFFSVDMAQTKSGEYGLPQTVLKLVPDVKVKLIPFDHWFQINTPADVAAAAQKIDPVVSH